MRDTTQSVNTAMMARRQRDADLVLNKESNRNKMLMVHGYLNQGLMGVPPKKQILRWGSEVRSGNLHFGKT